MDLETKP